MASEFRQRVERVVVRPAEDGPGPERYRNQGARLSRVDEVERLLFGRLPFRLDVHDLAAHHAEPARRERHLLDHLEELLRLHDPHGGSPRDDAEGVGEQGITRQDGDGLAENLVARRLAAAGVIVVHGREIVVDEGVGVDELERAGRGHDDVDRAADGLGGCDAEDRAKALPPGEHTVAGGPEDHGRLAGLGGKVKLESLIDKGLP